MKKIALLVMGLIIGVSIANAQDTLLFEDFNDTNALGGYYNNTIFDFPPGIYNDTSWYDFDEDGFTDANTRPSAWFANLSGGFADQDTNDFCLMSSSWFSSPDQASNWIFLPAIQITNGPTAWLKWQAAPRQTPLYLDGYEIRISTSTNDYQTAYTDTVYTAGEYLTGNETMSSDFSQYTFSSGFIHGLDGNYIECNNPCVDYTDSARYIGIQRPDSVSLAAYDNMVIYIAFHHNAFDDNLISLDDILVIEQIDPTFSIESVSSLEGQVYPNPATDFINVKFDIEKYHNAKIQMVNGSGQVIYTTPLVTSNHRIDLQNVAAGVYFVKIMADEGNLVKKVIVSK